MRKPVLILVAFMLAGATCAGVADGGSTSPVNVDIQAVTLSGRVTNLSRNPASDTSPAVSPNGREIAFVSSRSGRPDLYLMTRTGGNVRRLTTSPLATGGIAGPSAVAGDGYTSISWSPDGRRLAFDAANATVAQGCMENCTDWRVLVVNADGSGLRLVADGADFAAWSPDGLRLAYYSGYEQTGESTTVTVTTLATGKSVVVHAFNGGPSAAPTWSPDGRWIAFESNPVGPRSRVEIASARGGRARTAAMGEEPAWSPDGRRLAFVADGLLFTVAADGGSPAPLSRAGAQIELPTWSPNGRWIACERLTLTRYTRLIVNSQLVAVGAHTGIEHTLTREPTGTSFDGGPSWTSDGRKVVVAAGVRAAR
jgi:Tol biopolymer transport system component